MQAQRSGWYRSEDGKLVAVLSDGKTVIAQGIPDAVLVEFVEPFSLDEIREAAAGGR